MTVDMDKVRRESIRWTILLTLNNGRPTYLYEEVVLAVVQAVYPDASALEVRRELDYLDDRKLISVVKEPGGRWRGELTHYGVDVAEYTVDCLPGIARPPKYW
ncbi:hypothetical protein EPN44_16005 [bacterium]|nr:MAG: hypothetical protein EPN44_16005 [bacterium]